MFFPRQNKNKTITAEPSSKRSKTRGPIFCLFPAEVEKIANEVCEVQKNVCLTMLSNKKSENKKSKELRAKNKIVENIIDENLSPILKAIAEEISLSMRDVFAEQIYDHIKKTAGNSLNQNFNTYRDEESVLKAGKCAKERRSFRKYKV